MCVKIRKASHRDLKVLHFIFLTVVNCMKIATKIQWTFVAANHLNTSESQNKVKAKIKKLSLQYWVLTVSVPAIWRGSCLHLPRVSVHPRVQTTQCFRNCCLGVNCMGWFLRWDIVRYWSFRSLDKCLHYSRAVWDYSYDKKLSNILWVVEKVGNYIVEYPSRFYIVFKIIMIII